ncbi:hypothetical protein DY000_02035787, partial [Brassica cretica]
CFSEEKRDKAEKESDVLLVYTRKAIQRLTYLKKILAQLEEDVVPCELCLKWRMAHQGETVRALRLTPWRNKALALKKLLICDKMENWRTNLVVMAAKEDQYIQQYKKYEVLLNRVGYGTKISHRELVEMAEHRKELEKMTKPVVDTLKSYQDLPPDKALAALAIEDKKRQFAAAEKYLEEVLQSALETNDE